MSRYRSQVPFITARRNEGGARGRLTGPMARRLGLRRLLTTSRRAGRTVSLVLLIGLSWVLLEFFVRDAFFVYGADVRGNQLLSARQIYEASGIDSYSIFWIQPGAVEAALESLPYVRAATVRCWLPSRVEIFVEERDPIILWHVRDKILWVDREGRAMEPLTTLSGLIKVEDTAGEAVDANGNMNPEIVIGVQYIRQLLPKVDFFNYNRTYGLQFVTPEGVQVYLGGGQPALGQALGAGTGDMAYKVQIFDAVRRQIGEEGRKVHLIDLRYENEPYFQ
jgi:cell division septal protein FtsQ